MRIVHSSHGKFHHHDLARELHARGLLEQFFTGYPRWKLKQEDLPYDRVSTFPWIETPFMALLKAGLMRGALRREVEWLLFETFDRYVSRHLPECDVFIGLSCAGLYTGRVAQKNGALHVCDRGSTHIVVQDRLLREEFIRWGANYPGIDPRVIDKEQAEYNQADVITVPSEFVRRSFIERGVAPGKIVKVPYGVNLGRFEKVVDPAPNRFDVVFVGSISFRKGVPDLLDAFEALHHPRKSLTVVGGMAPEMAHYLKARRFDNNVRFTGYCPQFQLKHIFSRSHVMVLPSIEEGLALVMAQAQACGCPVIASEHTGAHDLFENGVQGFIVPIRDPAAITERMQRLADDPNLRWCMSEAAFRWAHDKLRGWRSYGDRILSALTDAHTAKQGHFTSSSISVPENSRA